MIKATGTMGDIPLLLLGLSDENITRLVLGEPISFNLDELGLESRAVVIIYGKTEDDIKNTLIINKLYKPEEESSG